jgi:hypothetical protein
MTDETPRWAVRPTTGRHLTAAIVRLRHPTASAGRVGPVDRAIIVRLPTSQAAAAPVAAGADEYRSAVVPVTPVLRRVRADGCTLPPVSRETHGG